MGHNICMGHNKYLTVIGSGIDTALLFESSLWQILFTFRGFLFMHKIIF